MTPGDFIIALQNLNDFLDTPLKEVYEEGINYPIGEGYEKIRVYFTHYQTFNEAIHKWKDRLSRMDLEHIGIMLTNWNGDYELLQSFDRLPYKNKVVFTDKNYPEFKSAVYLKGLKSQKSTKKIKNVYLTQNFITGKRYIDQFNYVEFINNL